MTSNAIRATCGARRAPIWLALSLLAACATPERQARQLADAGHPEAALALLAGVNADKSTDVALRAAYLDEREATLRALVEKADVARREGHFEEMRGVLRQVEAIAPDDPRAAWLRGELARQERHRKVMAEAQAAFDQQQWDKAEGAARSVLEEDPADTGARTLLTKISERQAARARDQLVLAGGSKPVSLELRDASLRSVFETLAYAGGINFVFDKDVPADSKVSLVLRNTTVDEAMRLVLATQQLERKILNGNSVLIYQNNAQKQREYQEMVTRSFYLVNADAKQVQSMIKTMVKTKDLQVDERLNLLMARDTPAAMRMIQRLVESEDLPEAEVMMEVEVMEVSSNLLRQAGLTWPTTASYGHVPGVNTASTTTTDYLSRHVNGSMFAYVANPLVTATLNGTSGDGNLLASPRIRARNHEKAHVQLGNKLPVFTTTTTGAGSVAGFVASSVSYLDVGLKLDVEPSVLLDNDIVLKVALEVSSVANQVSGPDGSVAYNVGTRQTSTSLRLKDGETEVLAGLIQDDDRKTAAGVPGLSEIPFLGALFGVRGNTHDKTEIVMLITPHIVRNVTLPPIASAAMDSGTDSQPGAPALRLSDDSARAGIDAAAAGAASAIRPAAAPESADVRPSAPEAVPTLSGPQDAASGSTVQLSVANPGVQPIECKLTFDANVLQPVAPTAAPGELALQVGAGASQSVAFVVKPTVSGGSTTVSSSTGESLTIALHPAAATTSPGQR